MTRLHAKHLYCEQLAHPSPLTWQARAVVFLAWVIALGVGVVWLCALGSLVWAGWQVAQEIWR